MTVQTDSTLQLLQDLVSIDSVNPSLVPGARGEAEIARRIASECTAAGLTVHVTEVAPGRPNVVGVLEGRAPGPTLMFCGHTDTVGVPVWPRHLTRCKGTVGCMVGGRRT
jgi:acetylornithine deacetylase